MISVPADRPVDTVVVDILRAVDTAARDLDVAYFVAGAMARDIVLRHVLGFETGRATRDIDLAVCVSSWEKFTLLKEALVATGSFTLRRDAHQRMYHASAYPVDLIPFGGVAHADGTLGWPPERAIVMNVTGYGEALETALRVEVDLGTVVRVVSLPALAMLKVFAWLDRGVRDRKDAQDLALLFRKYADTLDARELHATDADILLELDYDFERASPRLLGRHIRRLAAPETVSRLLHHLGVERTWHDLAIDMARDLTHVDDPVAIAHQLLRDFVAGLSRS
jgi:predicted nucleotidyltransferase